LKTAKRVHKYADDCLAKNHKISAREAYLRASNYYRVAKPNQIALMGISMGGYLAARGCCF
jgi:acetyl esterase/lipase